MQIGLRNDMFVFSFHSHYSPPKQKGSERELQACAEKESESKELACYRRLVAQSQPVQQPKVLPEIQNEITVSKYGFRSVKIKSGVLRWGQLWIAQTDAVMRSDIKLPSANPFG